MKVLLFSVTAGEGHNATANAMALALKERGAEVKIVDAYRTAGAPMYHLVSKGYLLASSYLKYGYGLVYRMLEHRPSHSYRLSPARLSGRPLAKKFKQVIDGFDPDVIVCTHPFAARILDITKQRYRFRAKTLAIVTDFTMHPYWEEALRLDLWVLPSEHLIPLAIKKGATKEKLLPLGIPIHPKFTVHTPKEEARARLGLDPSLPTLLVMGGAVGHANIRRALRRLDKLPFPLQLIVVCGKNKRAYKKVAATPLEKPVLSFGFVEDIPLLMDAADIIVSKPGGLTTSEALTRHLPMIITHPIPGQEDRNAVFLTAQGAAVMVSRRLSLVQAVTDLLSDAQKLSEMQACAKRLAKPSSVIRVTEVILALGEEAALPEK